MARKKVELTVPVRKAIESIRTGLAPTRIILFGSRVRGDAFVFSDWDLLVISKRFEGMPFRERLDRVLELVVEPIGQDLEPFCFTPREIKQRKKEIGFVSTALKTGIAV